ncbi:MULTISPECIES: hypothetical protein [Pseudomonas syringae group]|nr:MULTISPECIES: hypothetical protein [Pseudomonas syringae group]
MAFDAFLKEAFSGLTGFANDPAAVGNLVYCLKNKCSVKSSMLAR